MSWKLTKKLKETHLAPLANTFNRSSSTSTIVGDQPGKTSEDSARLTKAESQDARNEATFQANTAPPARPVQSGTLVITLHEAHDVELPSQAVRDFLVPPELKKEPNDAQAESRRLNPEAREQFAHSASRLPRESLFDLGAINEAPTNHGRYTSKYLPYAVVDFEKQQVFINAVSGSPRNPLWAGSTTQYKFDVCREADVTISLYIRNPESTRGRTDDIFLGAAKITPDFSENRQTYASNIPGQDANTEWRELDLIKDRKNGSMRFGITFQKHDLKALTADDFEMLKVVGRGSFGKVMQVRKKDNGRIYAMKTIRKAHIISRSEVAHTLAERSVLAQMNNPFIVPLKFSFQSPERLYLVLAFVNGGELFHHLKVEGRFKPTRARLYAAELLCALECVHSFKVMYRDLKPENILLDYTGHIALCDFGLCKQNVDEEDRTFTFCGTPEYLAPELLTSGGYTKTVDWWTFGILLYEMLTGLPPFFDDNNQTMYRKIVSAPLTFPDDPKIMPDHARELLIRLLDRDGSRRLGVNGAAEIKEFQFFKDIDWIRLLQRKYQPEFKPNVFGQTDTSNFDAEFTAEAPSDSYVEGPMLSQTMQQQFAGWSYNRPVEGLGDAGGSVQDPSFEGAMR